MQKLVRRNANVRVPNGPMKSFHVAPPRGCHVAQQQTDTWTLHVATCDSDTWRPNKDDAWTCTAVTHGRSTSVPHGKLTMY
jgi:hypothetical protein